MFGNPLFAKLIDEGIKNLNTPTEPQNLYDPIHYILSLSGKRIRPQLVLMGTELFGFSDFEKALPAALAIEYFHNFSLIHDDIMDKAPLRRGKSTVHQKWNDSVAILSGDALLVKAYEELVKCPERSIPSLLKTFNKIALEVCEGQQFDMDFEERSDVSEEEYINMIRMKTSVLLGGALELGAIIADASTDNREALYNFGVNLGIAFQLQDDILDAFGDPATFGKQIGGDILVNKKTILHILLKKSLKDADFDQFNDILKLSDEISSLKVEKMINLYHKYDILQLANQLKEKYMQFANKNLESISVSSSFKKDLNILADNLMNRAK